MKSLDEALADRVLTCVDCGYEFTWLVGEQQFFSEKRFAHHHDLSLVNTLGAFALGVACGRQGGA